MITPTKSFRLIDVPMPNMMIISNGTIRPFKSNPPHSRKTAGKSIEAVTEAKIRTVKENPFKKECERIAMARNRIKRMSNMPAAEGCSNMNNVKLRIAVNRLLK